MTDNLTDKDVERLLTEPSEPDPPRLKAQDMSPLTWPVFDLVKFVSDGKTYTYSPKPDMYTHELCSIQTILWFMQHQNCDVGRMLSNYGVERHFEVI